MNAAFLSQIPLRVVPFGSTFRPPVYKPRSVPTRLRGEVELGAVKRPPGLWIAGLLVAAGVIGYLTWELFDD